MNSETQFIEKCLPCCILRLWIFICFSYFVFRSAPHSPVKWFMAHMKRSILWAGKDLETRKWNVSVVKLCRLKTLTNSWLSSVFRSGLLSTLVGEKSVTQRWEVSTGTQKVPWTSQVMVWKCSHSGEISLLLGGVLYWNLFFVHFCI